MVMAGCDQDTGTGVVRRLHEAFNERDRDALLRCLSEDVAWQVAGSHPLAGNYEGRNHLWDAFFEPMWPSPARIEDHDILEHGEYVIALEAAIHNFGEGEQSWETAEVFRLEGGRVVERREFTSRQPELDRLLTRGCAAGAATGTGPG
jgi:ketosteroid isomerase-like protein